MESRTAPSRRTVVKGAGAVVLGAVGVGTLAACSDGSAATSAGVTFGNDPAAQSSAEGGSSVSPGAASATSKSPAKASTKASAKSGDATTKVTAKPSTKATTTKPVTPAPGSTTTKPAPAPAPPAPPAPAPPAPAPAPPAPAPAGPPAGAIIQVTDIPNGGSTKAGGMILSRSGNSVHGFDWTCPHMGCEVGAGGSTLVCPCHGSSFNASDGSLINGPATRGLTGRSVSVVNGWVVP